jgi:hypothetical protein
MPRDILMLDKNNKGQLNQKQPTDEIDYSRT